MQAFFTSTPKKVFRHPAYVTETRSNLLLQDFNTVNFGSGAYTASNRHPAQDLECTLGLPMQKIDF